MAISTALAIHGGPPTIPAGPPAWPPADPDVREALQAALADGSWGRYHGPHVQRLAERLAEMHQLPFVLPCCSGTFAVELALRGLQIGAGHEVILAGYDFSGNFRAVESVGARPVLVDVDPASACLHAEQLAAAVAPTTRAVIVSHLHSGIADMQQVCALADRHDLSVVEDACQIPGGRVQGRIAGGWGHVAVLSFGGSKLLTAGRGGAILTRREDVFQRAKIFCERGNNAFPLSELQAALLVPQLARLDQRNAARRAAAQRLLSACDDLAALQPLDGCPVDSLPSYYKLAWLYDAAQCGHWPREAFLAAVQAEGVALDAGFRGFTRRSQRRCRHVGRLTHSRQAAEAAVLLHHPVLLEATDTLDHVAAALRKVARAAVASPV